MCVGMGEDMCVWVQTCLLRILCIKDVNYNYNRIIYNKANHKQNNTKPMEIERQNSMLTCIN